MENKTLKAVTMVALIALVSVLVSQFFPIAPWEIDDGKWEWIKGKIFSRPRKTVDYAIVGSSYAWCDIHPGVISENFPAALVWNLGKNWDGREIDYFIIKRLLKHHDVKNILLQFHDAEVERVHPNAASVMAPAEALAEMVFYLRHTKITDGGNIRKRLNTILSYIAQFSVRTFLHFCRPASVLQPELKKRIDLLGGFYQEYAGFEPKRADQALMKSQRWQLAMGSRKSFPANSRAAFYLDKIHRLCLAQRVNLYFVFVPHYGAPLPSQSTFHYLNRKGVVLIPDLQPVMGRENWLDRRHLFRQGAIRYTRELVKLLKNGKESSPYYDFYQSPVNNQN